MACMVASVPEQARRRDSTAGHRRGIFSAPSTSRSPVLANRHAQRQHFARPALQLLAFLERDAHRPLLFCRFPTKYSFVLSLSYNCIKYIYRIGNRCCQVTFVIFCRRSVGIRLDPPEPKLIQPVVGLLAALRDRGGVFWAR